MAEGTWLGGVKIKYERSVQGLVLKLFLESDAFWIPVMYISAKLVWLYFYIFAVLVITFYLMKPARKKCYLLLL